MKQIEFARAKLSFLICASFHIEENGLRFDDSQVKEVREYLYAVANIAFKTMNNNEENKVGDSYGN